MPQSKVTDSINTSETIMGDQWADLCLLGTAMISREQRTPFSEWWWTVDRPLLAAIIALMLGGIILSLAASPPVATRIGLDPFHFFNRHLLFLLPAFIVLIGVSFLSPRQIRRTALIVFALSIALVLLMTLVSLLVLEPDFGQTMLILMVWGALFFIAGMRMIWVLGLAGAASAGLFGAYLLVPHVAGRIKRFVNPASGDTFQVDTAMEAFSNGGWFGLGPGEGIAKRSLPDSHTDFVFAVAAEEFGIILCLALLALFAFVVIRTLSRAYATEDMFARFAASGLAILFGVQAAINMSVNLQLIPAKGMTLPFISYGGSSIISLAYGVGMLLALTRLRPRVEMESISDANAARSYA